MTLRPGEIDDRRCRDDAVPARQASSMSGFGGDERTYLFGPQRPPQRRRRRGRPSTSLRPADAERPGRVALAPPQQSRRRCRSRPSSTPSRAASGCSSASATYERLPGRRPALRAPPEPVDRAARRLGRRVSVQLIEIPSDSEINDNIIAYWRPKAADGGGQRGRGRLPAILVLAAARAAAARDRRRRPGSGRGSLDAARRFFVDFTGDSLDDAAPRGPQAGHDRGPGSIHVCELGPIPERKTVRVRFDLDPGNENACEMRLVLEAGGQADQRNMALSMDTLSDSDPAEAPSARPSGVEPATPPEKPPRHAGPVAPALVAARGAQPVAAAAPATPWLARLFVFGGGLALTAYGAHEMYQVVSVSRTTVLQWVLLALFTINFSWIALAFTSALLGFFGCCSAPARARGAAAGAAEPHRRRDAGLQRADGAHLRGPRGDPRIGRRDGARRRISTISSSPTRRIPTPGSPRSAPSWPCASALGPNARVYYRHRAEEPSPQGRQHRRFRHALGRRLRPHARARRRQPDDRRPASCASPPRWRRDPDAGIIQTLPLIINRNTLFARLQQFAARVYGPVIATGLSAWMGRDGNYWGHNAIIRTQAFADHCRPAGPARASRRFGGHILSHDFVEAALIRRAGWTVYMLPDLDGLLRGEPALADRPRRRATGAGARATCSTSRVIGAQRPQAGRRGSISRPASCPTSPRRSGCSSSIVGIALVLQTTYIRPEYFTRDFPPLPGLAAVRPRARA